MGNRLRKIFSWLKEYQFSWGKKHWLKTNVKICSTKKNIFLQKKKPFYHGRFQKFETIWKVLRPVNLSVRCCFLLQKRYICIFFSVDIGIYNCQLHQTKFRTHSSKISVKTVPFPGWTFFKLVCYILQFCLPNSFPDSAIIRSSHLKVLCEKCVFKNFSKFTKKNLWWSPHLNEVAVLQCLSFSKKRLRQKCFPKKIAKFLRPPFWLTIIEQLL